MIILSLLFNSFISGIKGLFEAIYSRGLIFVDIVRLLNLGRVFYDSRLPKVSWFNILIVTFNTGGVLWAFLASTNLSAYTIELLGVFKGFALDGAVFAIMFALMPCLLFAQSRILTFCFY